jgi:hypothetical protein
MSLFDVIADGARFWNPVDAIPILGLGVEGNIVKRLGVLQEQLALVGQRYELVGNKIKGVCCS